MMMMMMMTGTLTLTMVMVMMVKVRTKSGEEDEKVKNGSNSSLFHFRFHRLSELYERESLLSLSLSHFRPHYDLGLFANRDIQTKQRTRDSCQRDIGHGRRQKAGRVKPVDVSGAE